MGSEVVALSAYQENSPAAFPLNGHEVEFKIREGKLGG